MQLVIQENPTFKADIVIADDVGFTVTFKAVPPWKLGEGLPEDATESVKQVMIANNVVGLVTNWQGVKDEQGNDVPFSHDALNQLFNMPFGLLEKLMNAYVTAYGIESVKN